MSAARYFTNASDSYYSAMQASYPILRHRSTAMCKADDTRLTAALRPAPPGMDAAPLQGSRRRRLWELPPQSHCPVIGVCLSMPDVRRLLDKLFQGESSADDYGLHVGAVRECGTRNRVSEVLQRELERRYAVVLRQFAAVKTTENLAAHWRHAVEARDIAGPLWATLTHPRCDAALEDALLRQVHMIQHQAGAATRVEAREVQALTEANAQLALELGRAQQRGAQAQAERAADNERLNAQLMRLRAEAIARDTAAAAQNAEMELLRRAAPEVGTRVQLTQRVAELTQRVRELEKELHDLRRDARAAPPACAAPAGPARADEGVSAVEAPFDLGARSILCVGGRSGHIPIYRDLVERHGGRFAYHDGGIEDSTQRLGASLAAADLVICQAGCLNHNAYGIVKDHCKRTGKRCVYLDRPSAAGFARGLAQAVGAEAGRPGPFR